MIFVALMSLNHALILDCTYSFKNSYGGLNYLYACTARVFVGDGRNVSEKSTNHLPGYNNSDVQFLEIRNQSLRLSPRNFYLFFPNLVSLDLGHTELEEISNADLFGLSKLKVLQVHYNRLQVIENDLFKYSPSMIQISIDVNQIKHVGHNVFDHLRDLRSIWFGRNTCLSQDVDNNRTAVEILIIDLMRNCPATIEQTETRIINGDEFQAQISRQIAEQIEPLNDKIDSNRIELKTDITGLEEQLRIIQHRLELLEGGTSCGVSGGA